MKNAELDIQKLKKDTLKLEKVKLEASIFSTTV